MSDLGAVSATLIRPPCKQVNLLSTDQWPGGLSDGLTLPCGLCGRVPAWDYEVADDLWDEVVPPEHKRGVVCLECLAGLPGVTPERLCASMQRVQFVAQELGLTIMLSPIVAFRYPRRVRKLR